MTLPKKITFLSLMAVMTIFLFMPHSHAKPGNDFSKDFGLIVHNANEERPVQKIKTLEVLLKYFDSELKFADGKAEVGFEDVDEDSRSYPIVEKACRLGIIDCAKGKFKPYAITSQQDFLEWFYKLKYRLDPFYLKNKYPKLPIAYFRYWLEARRYNLIPSKKMTYDSLQEFLYRDTVVEENLGQPYRQGLAIPLQDINADNYHNPAEIDSSVRDLRTTVDNLKSAEKLSKREETYLHTLEENINAFEKLKAELRIKPYILRIRDDLEPDVVKAIKSYGLQDVISSYTYYYITHLPYRQHNLTTGAKRIHGKVFLPEDEINMWNIVAEKGFWDFQYGWVILDGIEQWKFGGGLCGSTTMIFIPSWLAGLEVLERTAHSYFYKSLYPAEYIGLDATVFRPRPNMRLKNNLDSPIVYNVIDDTENKLLTVEIIGNSTYKGIETEGPIYDKWNKIRWIRKYIGFDGSVEKSEELNTTYGAIY